MSDLPSPLVPVDVDLRDFSFMPLDIIRLFGSRFHAIATDAEWRAGVTLWAKSFHQVPAASVPDDDVELCRLAELGRDVKAWRKVREVALHGWILCNDGRLYHPVVAEKAREAWARKQAQRTRSAKGNAARWGSRDVPKDAGNDPQRIPEGSLKESLKDPKGQGQGQGQGKEDIPPSSAPPLRRQEPDCSAKASPHARGSRIPNDWSPDLDFAKSLGLVNGKAEAEAAKFRDYWTAQPGQRGVKADWPATWRNWLRKAVEQQPGRANGNGAAAEPAWRTEQRERVAQFAGPFAAKRTPTTTALEVIDAIAKRVD